MLRIRWNATPAVVDCTADVADPRTVAIVDTTAGSTQPAPVGGFRFPQPTAGRYLPGEPADRLDASPTAGKKIPPARSRRPIAPVLADRR